MRKNIDVAKGWILIYRRNYIYKKTVEDSVLKKVNNNQCADIIRGL